MPVGAGLHKCRRPSDTPLGVSEIFTLTFARTNLLFLLCLAHTKRDGQAGLSKFLTYGRAKSRRRVESGIGALPVQGICPIVARSYISSTVKGT